MPTDMSLLFQQQQSRIPNKVGYVGDLKYAPRDGNAHFIGNGWNTAKPTSQTSRVTFAAPGTIDPGKKVYLQLVKPNGQEVLITLRNDAAVAAPADQILINAVNGSGGLTAPTNYELTGYKAVSVTAGSVVDITGTPGTKFALYANGFGAVGVPPSATIATTVSAVCAGGIKFGYAVVNNPVLYSGAAGVEGAKSIISPEWDRIVSYPSNAPGETFVGIAIRSINDVQPAGTDGCCDDTQLTGYYHCNDCVHYINNTDHNNQILVQLEPIPAGTVQAATPINQSVYYRNVVGTGAGQTELGSLSLYNVAGTALARDTGSNQYWVVKETVDVARRLYYIGLIADS